MFDYQSMFHTGFLVRDLDREMARFAQALGIKWAKPYVYDALNIWTPDRGDHQVRIEVAYSSEGPQHLELIAGPSGTVYDPALQNGHHAGFWVDDVSSTAASLLDRGWNLVVSGASPERGFGGFSYFRPPNEGMLVEIVSSAAKPRFENWWSGAIGPVL